MSHVGDLITVRLEKMVYGGAALGRLPDGRAVFVPFALPGEVARARILEEKRGHVRAALVEIIFPAPNRISPRCSHFGECGGCHYQHIPYEEQLVIKADIVRDQLVRIGQIPDPPIQPIVASPLSWDYRNHAQFHLSKAGKLGFIRSDGQSVLPISECHLLETGISSLWAQLDFEPGLKLERVSLRQGADAGMLLVLESQEPPELELEADLSVVHLKDNEIVVMAGEPALEIQVLDRNFLVSAASFFQVNTAVAGKMVNHLIERLPLNPGATMLDVYCGAGLFSAFFAAHLGRLIGIESSASACDDFIVNLDEFSNVELYEAPAEAVLPELQVKADIILVDPPRAGLHPQAMTAILRLNPAVIAYISCDPATLARDAGRLIKSGYHLEEVTPFDQFPQTYHIETISIFHQ